jgi:methylated-DNA-[protein]-cysteine S-methyltransferase
MMVTKYQSEVYRLCGQVPEGYVTTYKLINDALIRQGVKSSSISVGQALKRNPFAPQVPCHRVVASDLSIGGFYGKRDCPKKKKMLQKEGIHFTSENCIDSSHLFANFHSKPLELEA